MDTTRRNLAKCRTCRTELVEFLPHGQYAMLGGTRYSGREKSLICPACNTGRPFEFR